MVFDKITGSSIVILGILIGLVYFDIIQNTFFAIDFVVIGIIIFIIHELINAMLNFSHTENKVIGLGVPVLFSILAGSYFIKDFMPQPISQVLLLMIAVLMIAEGLYRMH